MFTAQRHEDYSPERVSCDGSGKKRARNLSYALERGGKKRPMTIRNLRVVTQLTLRLCWEGEGVEACQGSGEERGRVPHEHQISARCLDSLPIPRSSRQKGSWRPKRILLRVEDRSRSGRTRFADRSPFPRRRFSCSTKPWKERPSYSVCCPGKPKKRESLRARKKKNKVVTHFARKRRAVSTDRRRGGLSPAATSAGDKEGRTCRPRREHRIDEKTTKGKVSPKIEK